MAVLNLASERTLVAQACQYPALGDENCGLNVRVVARPARSYRSEQQGPGKCGSYRLAAVDQP
jgi:hypothetical protein